MVTVADYFSNKKTSCTLMRISLCKINHNIRSEGGDEMQQLSDGDSLHSSVHLLRHLEISRPRESLCHF